jgi:hypothetical protein
VGCVLCDESELFVFLHGFFHLSKKYSAENTAPVGEIRQGEPI